MMAKPLLLPRCLRMPALFILAVVAACAANPAAPDDDIRKSLLGKSRAEILACAGLPAQENQTEQGLVLRYYKEAPMFDESGVFLKGSQPGVHRGCWVSLLLKRTMLSGPNIVPLQSRWAMCSCAIESLSPARHRNRTRLTAPWL